VNGLFESSAREARPGCVRLSRVASAHGRSAPRGNCPTREHRYDLVHLVREAARPAPPADALAWISCAWFGFVNCVDPNPSSRL
jgi:hypothetical protein